MRQTLLKNYSCIFIIIRAAMGFWLSLLTRCASINMNKNAKLIHEKFDKWRFGIQMCIYLSLIPITPTNNNHFINSKYFLLLEYVCVCYRNEYFKNKTVHIQSEHQKHWIKKYSKQKQHKKKREKNIEQWMCGFGVTKYIGCAHTSHTQTHLDLWYNLYKNQNQYQYQ